MANVDNHSGPIDIKDPALFSTVATPTSFLLTDGDRIAASALATWLAGAPANFTGDQTGSQIVALLEALADANKLSASALNQDGATDGQALVWSNANDQFEPATVAGGASVTHTTLTSNALSIDISHFGSAPTLTVNGSGDYVVVIPAGTLILQVDIFGNNTTLQGLGEFGIGFDNSANSRDLSFCSDIYATSNGSFRDPFSDTVNHTRTVVGNVTTHTYPNMNTYGATGFDLILR